MLKRAGLVAVMAVLCAGTATAQPGDPYAADQQVFRQRAYQQARDRFLNEVKVAHNA